jgi:hypothetical protein
MAMTGDDSRELSSVDHQLGIGSKETKITRNTIPKKTNLFLNTDNHHHQTSAEFSQTKFPIKVSEIGESNSKVKIESTDDDFKKFDEMIKSKVDDAKMSVTTPSEEENLRNPHRSFSTSRETFNTKGQLFALSSRC